MENYYNAQSPCVGCAGAGAVPTSGKLLKVHPAAVRCDVVLHRAFRARGMRQTGIGGEVRHDVASGVAYETSKA